MGTSVLDTFKFKGLTAISNRSNQRIIAGMTLIKYVIAYRFFDYSNQFYIELFCFSVKAVLSNKSLSTY